MITADQLQPFCSTDPVRPYIHQPWSHSGFTYATNGHVLVRVPLLADMAEQEKAPNCDKIFAAVADQVELIPLPVLDFPEPEKSECVSCDGRGNEHDCPDCSHDCEECGGSGEIEERVSATLNGVIYNAKYLTLISGLPQPVRFALSPPKDAPARFTFGGDGEGALMPMRSGYPNHIEIKGQRSP